MEKLRTNPAGIVALICAVLLAVGVLTFAGPCVHDDGSAAACHGASVAVVAAAAVAAVAALAGVVLGTSKAAGAAYAASALAGVFAAAAPGPLFPLCLMQTMRCWTTMRPFALVCGAALCVVAVVAAVQAFRSSARPVSR